jgi:hypothetical protein
MSLLSLEEEGRKKGGRMGIFGEEEWVYLERKKGIFGERMPRVSPCSKR